MRPKNVRGKVCRRSVSACPGRCFRLLHCGACIWHCHTSFFWCRVSEAFSLPSSVAWATLPAVPVVRLCAGFFGPGAQK